MLLCFCFCLRTHNVFESLRVTMVLFVRRTELDFERTKTGRLEALARHASCIWTFSSHFYTSSSPTGRFFLQNWPGKGTEQLFMAKTEERISEPGPERLPKNIWKMTDASFWKQNLESERKILRENTHGNDGMRRRTEKNENVMSDQPKDTCLKKMKNTRHSETAWLPEKR